MTGTAKFLSSDVLVIGSGGAGLRAALAAARAGATVTVVAKGNFGRAGATVMAGGIAIPDTGDGDCVQTFFEDMIWGGAFLNDQSLVWLLADQVGNELCTLESLGVRFDRDRAGRLERQQRGGHRFPRFVSRRRDAAGQAISLGLASAVRAAGVRVLTDLFVTDLIVDGGRLVGAIGLLLDRGDLVVLPASATVLAAGGGGRLFPVTTTPAEATGDSYALALRAGLTLVDMEMITFHPAGLYTDGLIAGVSVLEPAHHAEKGGRLVDGQGQPFLQNYDSRQEYATRDVIARAEYFEIAQGRGTPHGGVYLDLRGIPAEVRARFPKESRLLYENCLLAGVDITVDDRIEIGPQAHYVIGGLPIDTNATTDMPGLFACGESVGGIHGANRIAGVGLAEAMVFGRLAGEGAARHAAASPIASQDVMTKAITIGNPSPVIGTAVRPGPFIDQLREIMGRCVGVVRDAASLTQGRAELATLRAEVDAELPRYGIASSSLAPRDRRSALELHNMIATGEAMAASAELRWESRGAHYRSDAPKRRDDLWLKHSTVAWDDGEWLSGDCPVDLKRLCAPEFRHRPFLSPERLM